MAFSVELRNVTKSFPGGVVAVDDLSFTVDAGEFVTLLGPSGCGKTTTLRLLAGFEFPDSGSVRIDDADITHLPPNRRPVNTVFQDYAVFPHMTVRRNVEYGLRFDGVPRSERRERALAALELVGLPEKADEKPGNLSGGQRQRVALARAIVKQPRVLLLDEPLSALDAKLRKSMQAELRRLHREIGITFVLVTHDQSEALALSDRVIVRADGRLQQVGTPAEVYDWPVSPYVADFIGSANLLDGLLVEAAGKLGAVTIDGWRLEGVLLAEGLATGDPVTVAIRPERIRAELDPGNGEGIDASVLDSMFSGGSVRLRVGVGGVSMDVDLPVSTHLEGLSVPKAGDSIRIGVTPDNVGIFARRP